MACSSSCSGSAGAGCSGCGGTCSGGCSGCSGCSGSCSGSCRSGCTGSCTATCAANCSGKCNTQCTGGASAQIASFVLQEKYQQSDIQAISDAIYYEAGPNRRNKSPTSLTFSVGDTLSASKMLTIINNLSKAGQTVDSSTYSVAQGQSAKKSFAEALISKIKTAYAETIKG